MGFKSEAQKQKFIQLEKEGKLQKGTVERMLADTPNTKLPERVKPKQRPKTLKEIQNRRK
jgi:hypothetical protein